jgi:hypothetical protein
VRERPILFSAPMVRAILAGTKTQTRRVAKGLALEWLSEGFEPAFVADDANRLCPYGQPGDRLWVREAWAKTHCLGHEMFVYRAEDNRTDYGGPWKPSIHMPRGASRILLKIVSVRVERLQDISGNDCIAEGVWRVEDKALGRSGEAVAAYRDLWEQINAPGSWDANPWVWVVEFRRVA